MSAVLALTATGGTGKSWVVRADGTGQHVGAFAVAASPTLRGAEDALGREDACRSKGARRGSGSATAVWGRLGVAIYLQTLGALPPGLNGCQAPDSIQIDRIRVTGSRWRTARGLRVGSTVQSLRSLYPRALRTRGRYGQHGSGYLLVWNRVPCVVGDCGGEAYDVDAPLVAETKRGAVRAFVLAVGAQGD